MSFVRLQLNPVVVIGVRSTFLNRPAENQQSAVVEADPKLLSNFLKRIFLDQFFSDLTHIALVFLVIRAVFARDEVPRWFVDRGTHCRSKLRHIIVLILVRPGLDRPQPFREHLMAHSCQPIRDVGGGFKYPSEQIPHRYSQTSRIFSKPRVINSSGSCCQ